MALTDLHPIPISLNPVRRFAQLFAGLALYGTSLAMMTRAGLGLDPWNVLHEGLTKTLGLSFGTVTALASLGVLLLWIPLRQRLSIGTIANIIVISVTVDAVRVILLEQHTLAWQILLLIGGVTLNAFATATYVGARLGPGPRDGLMTGLHARTGRSVRLVRTVIELSVLAIGWPLGGTIGVGTVVYAVAIGPLTQFFLPQVTYREPAAATARRTVA